jgi:hypothetical protein
MRTPPGWHKEVEQSLERSTQPPLALQREGRGDQGAGGGEKYKFLHGILLFAGGEPSRSRRRAVKWFHERDRGRT